MTGRDDTRLAALVWAWLLVCVALGVLGGRAVAATYDSPLPWVQWLGLSAFAPMVLVFAVGLVVLARVMMRRP